MSVIRWKNDVGGALDALNNDTADAWVGDVGSSGITDAIAFKAGGDPGAASSAGVEKAKSPTLTTLVSFTGLPGGFAPQGSLIADAAGDLFGTTSDGGVDNDGTVFEIVATKHGYAIAPTTLVSFTGADGAVLDGALITDAAGDLFGTTVAGGADDEGTVFEIAKTKSGYASTPTTLVSFKGADGEYPPGGLIADAAGDLFGTTASGGANGDGTVFEIARTKGGYANAPTILVNFSGEDGRGADGALITDAAGDLFGTTTEGGTNGEGNVYEIAKTGNGYAGTATTLVSFTGANGQNPHSALIADAAGDLFGTTNFGGADNDGTVFEVVKTKSGYASEPTTLVSFTGGESALPYAGLIADAAGDLFGTTYQGGTDNAGTVYEIAKTKHGYADAPTILATFAGPNGAGPYDSLIADAAGDLFGTTSGGGTDQDGTVFEVSKVKDDVTVAKPAAFVQALAGHGAIRSGSISPAILASRDDMPTLFSIPRAAS